MRLWARECNRNSSTKIPERPLTTPNNNHALFVAFACAPPLSVLNLSAVKSPNPSFILLHRGIRGRGSFLGAGSVGVSQFPEPINRDRFSVPTGSRFQYVGEPLRPRRLRDYTITSEHVLLASSNNRAFGGAEGECFSSLNGNRVPDRIRRKTTETIFTPVLKYEFYSLAQTRQSRRHDDARCSTVMTFSHVLESKSDEARRTTRSQPAARRTAPFENQV